MCFDNSEPFSSRWDIFWPFTSYRKMTYVNLFSNRKNISDTLWLSSLVRWLLANHLGLVTIKAEISLRHVLRKILSSVIIRKQIKLENNIIVKLSNIDNFITRHNQTRKDTTNNWLTLGYSRQVGKYIMSEILMSLKRKIYIQRLLPIVTFKSLRLVKNITANKKHGTEEVQKHTNL